MPTVLDKIARPIAKSLIQQFGASVNFTQVEQGEYDPSQSEAPVVERTYIIKALVEDYNLVDSGAGFAGGLIEFGDKKITIAATSLPFTPTAGDKVEAVNQTFTIIRITTIYSGEQPALYEMQGRR